MKHRKPICRAIKHKIEDGNSQTWTIYEKGNTKCWSSGLWPEKLFRRPDLHRQPCSSRSHRRHSRIPARALGRDRRRAGRGEWRRQQRGPGRDRYRRCRRPSGAPFSRQIPPLLSSSPYGFCSCGYRMNRKARSRCCC